MLKDHDEQKGCGVSVSKNRQSGCKSIRQMFTDLGNTFDAYEVCLRKPGEGPFYEYAQEHFPVHASCPVFSGIIKCMEVECRLALKKDVTIEFKD